MKQRRISFVPSKIRLIRASRRHALVRRALPCSRCRRRCGAAGRRPARASPSRTPCRSRSRRRNRRPRVDHPRGQVGHALERERLGHHLRDAGPSMRPNSPIGRLNALRRVLRFDGELDEPAAHADAAAGQPEARSVAELHRDHEASPDLSQQRGRGDLQVVEGDGRGGCGAHAELRLARGVGHARAALDEEGRDLRLGPLLGRRRPREDHEEAGVGAVGDPGLGPVDHEAVRAGVGARLDRRGVAPGRQLGQREGGDEVPAREARQVAVLLLLRPEHEQRHGPERRVRPEHPRDRGVEAGDLLHHPRVAGRREPEAAVRLGDPEPEEPDCG